MTAHRNRAGYSTSTPRTGETHDQGAPRPSKWKNAPKKKSTETKRANKSLHEKLQELRLQENGEMDFYGE